jgi:UDP-glucose 6-dehydrogenase
MLEIFKRSFPSLRGVRVAVLGLVFKPDTDDMREFPAIHIVHYLLAEGAIILAYYSVAIPEARKILDDK